MILRIQMEVRNETENRLACAIQSLQSTRAAGAEGTKNAQTDAEGLMWGRGKGKGCMCGRRHYRARERGQGILPVRRNFGLGNGETTRNEGNSVMMNSVFGRVLLCEKLGMKSHLFVLSA
jgi:hypothetical protein